MNKNDVVRIMEAVASDSFFKDFKIKKSNNSILCNTDYGYKRVYFLYNNSYDLKRGALALEIRPHYFIRFNVLHKWFEKYSKRTLKDQRDDYSIGFNGGMIGETDEFFFLENRKCYESDLQKLRMEIVKNANRVFSKFATLNDYYDYCIEDVLMGKHSLPDMGFEWVVEYLIATKIVHPSKYHLVKELVLQRVDYMLSRNEPNIKMYYKDLPNILVDLEQTTY